MSVVPRTFPLRCRILPVGAFAFAACSSPSEPTNGPSGKACHGDRTIQTREQYTAFLQEHCTEVAGNLTLRSLDDGFRPTNLQLAEVSGLRELQKVGGTLGLIFNEKLSSLTGLENLREVGGLFVGGVGGILTSFAGLEGLTDVHGDLSFGYNDSLLEFRGLESVTTVMGTLRAEGNPSLGTISPLLAWPPNTVHGALRFWGNEKLPACQVTDFDAIQSEPGAMCERCEDNDDTATCGQALRSSGSNVGGGNAAAERPVVARTVATTHQALFAELLRVQLTSATSAFSRGTSN